MTDDTLLEKARAVPVQTYRHSEFAAAELEALAVAWVQGEVSTAQVQKTIKRSGSTFYSLLFTALKRAVAAGRIKLYDPQ